MRTLRTTSRRAREAPRCMRCESSPVLLDLAASRSLELRLDLLGFVFELLEAVEQLRHLFAAHLRVLRVGRSVLLLVGRLLIRLLFGLLVFRRFRLLVLGLRIL